MADLTPSMNRQNSPPDHPCPSVFKHVTNPNEPGHVPHVSLRYNQTQASDFYILPDLQPNNRFPLTHNLSSFSRTLPNFDDTIFNIHPLYPTRDKIASS